jgi:hypothetical protein
MTIQIDDPWLENFYHEEFGANRAKFIEEVKILLMKKYQPRLSRQEIQKAVENSQRIEGYEPISKELEVEAFMKEHNVQVSA